MEAARERILALGGAEACNTFSTFYFACLGIVSWEACPVIPPQIVHLPGWFPFHLRKVAAWTRTMILPLALCSALRPVRPLPPAWATPARMSQAPKEASEEAAWQRPAPLPAPQAPPAPPPTVPPAARAQAAAISTSRDPTTRWRSRT